MSDELREFDLVYLATPYSKYKPGIELAFQHASALAAALLKLGVKVYSPIAHTHPLAIYGNIDPLDHSIWIPFDEAMMKACGALVVARMEGWQESRGIAHEIKFFKKRGKPVFYMDPTSLALISEKAA